MCFGFVHDDVDDDDANDDGDKGVNLHTYTYRRLYVHTHARK